MARRKIQGTAIPVLQSLFRTYASPAATSRPPVSKLGIPNVDHIIAVASGKGGVGKSTTAVNLAVAMAQNLGLRIGVLDADIYGPSIPRLLHLHGKPDVDSNDLMLPLKNHGVTAMSMGFLIEEDSAAVWRGPMVMSALDTFIRKVNWGNLDCLVIDHATRNRRRSNYNFSKISFIWRCHCQHSSRFGIIRCTAGCHYV
ncbi:hypothetical protein Ndes2526B_g05156 [Nannochloris sp. 'desiccata']